MIERKRPVFKAVIFLSYIPSNGLSSLDVSHMYPFPSMPSLIVASLNPVKIAAARAGFTAMFPHLPCEVAGLSVPSGVADQPHSEAETWQGAQQRAVAARAARPQADYWIGIEGGVALYGDQWLAFGWVVVLGDQRQGQARSASFALPPAMVALMAQGLELGEADDRLFGTHNAKQRGGTVGALTQGIIDRQQLYQPAVSLALLPFAQPSLYPGP
jgi:inosine/xanthosine triphosphatase